MRHLLGEHLQLARQTIERGVGEHRADLQREHEEHESMLEWIGGRFDSEEFDAKKATKEMKKGLPDWKKMK